MNVFKSLFTTYMCGIMSTRTSDLETEISGTDPERENLSEISDLLESDGNKVIEDLVFLNDSKYSFSRTGSVFRAEDLPDSLLYPAIENEAELYLYDEVFVGGPIKYSSEDEEKIIGRVVSSLGLREYKDLSKIHNSETTEFLNELYSENPFVQERRYDDDIPFQDFLVNNRSCSEY